MNQPPSGIAARHHQNLHVEVVTAHLSSKSRARARPQARENCPWRIHHPEASTEEALRGLGEALSSSPRRSPLFQDTASLDATCTGVVIAGAGTPHRSDCFTVTHPHTQHPPAPRKPSAASARHCRHPSAAPHCSGAWHLSMPRALGWLSQLRAHRRMIAVIVSLSLTLTPSTLHHPPPPSSIIAQHGHCQYGPETAVQGMLVMSCITMLPSIT